MADMALYLSGKTQWESCRLVAWLVLFFIHCFGEGSIFGTGIYWQAP